MRIGVDARHLPEGRGVARYLQHALAALAARHPSDEWIALVPGRAPVAVPDGVALRRTALPGRLLFGLGALSGRPALERLCGGALDALWMPAPAPIGLDGSAPLVLTVHDLAFVERPGDFTRYERAWHRAGRLRRLAGRAARVVAVSTPTRDALLRHWRLDPARVAVVPEGPGTPSTGTGTGTAGAPVPSVPYLLCVGALEPRKAPELLAGAFARARARGLDAELVFAGAGRLAGRLDGRPGVRLVGPVQGEQLDALYRGALAVVSPSWAEGFGLTPLEALARGVPAVVSDLPVYDETLGAGAVRFPAGDAEALADALLAVARDEALRTRVLCAGRAAIAALSWEACADGLHAAFEAAAGSR